MFAFHAEFLFTRCIYLLCTRLTLNTFRGFGIRIKGLCGVRIRVFPPHTRRTHTPLTPDTAGQHMDIFKRQLEIELDTPTRET
mgnify:CR=1 FL=1|jgi:hypothetical protein